MKSKAEVRHAIREALHFSSEEHGEKSALIRAAIIRETAWQQARTVAVFAPHGSEPDVESLHTIAGERVFCYPRLRDDALDFFRIAAVSELVVSRWNLREPTGDETHRIALPEIDLILVPGVAFTRDGRRLGRGGGYYDRLLARPEMRAVKIGVCFSTQLLDDLPDEPHDKRVDRVLCDA